MKKVLQNVEHIISMFSNKSAEMIYYHYHRKNG
jgi:hypothetical protein